MKRYEYTVIKARFDRDAPHFVGKFDDVGDLFGFLRKFDDDDFVIMATVRTKLTDSEIARSIRREITDEQMAREIRSMGARVPMWMCQSCGAKVRLIPPVVGSTPCPKCKLIEWQKFDED